MQSMNDICIDMTHSQLDALHTRTGFETIILGVRSSTNHYTAPIVHATSSKIPTFFQAVIKKPVTDLATSIEAFCLSGVDGEFMIPSPKTCKHLQAASHRCTREVGETRVAIEDRSCIVDIQQATYVLLLLTSAFICSSNDALRNDLKGGGKSNDIQEL